MDASVIFKYNVKTTCISHSMNKTGIYDTYQHHSTSIYNVDNSQSIK